MRDQEQAIFDEFIEIRKDNLKEIEEKYKILTRLDKKKKKKENKMN